MKLNRTRVTVANGTQVTYEGDIFAAGETLDVDRDTADRWLAAGFVIPAAKAR